MLEWFLGGAAAGVAAVIGEQQAHKAAKKVARSARDLAHLVKDTIDGGTELGERLRENGYHLCNFGNGHTHPTTTGRRSNGMVGWKCLDCSSTWEAESEDDGSRYGDHG